MTNFLRRPAAIFPWLSHHASIASAIHGKLASFAICSVMSIEKPKVSCKRKRRRRKARSALVAVYPARRFSRLSPLLRSWNKLDTAIDMCE